MNALFKTLELKCAAPTYVRFVRTLATLAAAALTLCGCLSSGDGSNATPPPPVVPPPAPPPPLVGSHYRATRLEPSAPEIVGYAINSGGQIVGYHGPSQGSGFIGAVRGPFTPFIYSNDVTDLCNPGCKTGNGLGINNAGQVTGQADGHAFLYSSGKMVDLGTLGGSESAGYGINDTGQVVGDSTTAESSTAKYIHHAFIFSGGAMVDMGTLGGSSSTAKGINNKGQATGWADTPGGVEFAHHAFLYSGGTMTDLGAPPGLISEGNAINDKGEITGCVAVVGTVCHAFLYTGGRMIDFNEQFPSGGSSWGAGINNNGQVVGTAVDSSPHAFLYSEGKVFDLAQLVTDGLDGWPLQHAVGINDSGQIVAYTCNIASVAPPFCLTWRLDPIP